MRVPCDASADDDGRRNIEPLAGEIDRLDGLDALQLVDGQGMAVDTVAAERRVTWPAVTLLPPNTTTERDLPQRDERLALGQHLGELRCSLWTEPVAIEAATSKGGGTQSPV